MSNLARSPFIHLLCQTRSPLQKTNLRAVVIALFITMPCWGQSNSNQITDTTQQRERHPGMFRELFVPFEELDVLLGNQAQRVYMTREEFEDLKSRAKVVPQDPIPLNATILSSSYRAKMEFGQAIISGELEIELLADGLQMIELDASGIVIRNATVDGRTAQLGANEQRGPSLFLAGKGRHLLKLDMVTNVRSSAAVQSLTMQLPVAPSAKLSLVVPGNIEIKSGATVLTRQYEATSQETIFDLVPEKGLMNIVMSLNNRMLHEQARLLARSVLIDEVTQAYERLYLTTSVNVLQGATDKIRMEIPSDFEVSSVATPLLSSWNIEPGTASKTLVIKLRESTSERIVARISLMRLPPVLEAWTLPTIRSTGVVGQSMVVALLVDESLNTESIRDSGLIPIDGQGLARTLAESLSNHEAAAPRLRILSAYYAPHGSYELNARFTRPQGNLTVATNLHLRMEDRGLQLDGGFGLMTDSEKLFSFDFTGPSQWHVERIALADGTPLQAERFVAADRTRYNVKFPSAAPVGTQRDVVFHARHVPDAWMSDWTKLSVTFPDFHVEKTTEDQGSIAVQVTDDLEVRPESTTNLLSISDSEKSRLQQDSVASVAAYSYQRHPWSAVFEVTRPTPRITAHNMSFFKFQAESVAAHYELNFEIGQARTQQLVFSLPESTPAEISIRGIDETRLKETLSTTSDSRRIWTVTLAQPSRGSAKLAVDFTQQLASTSVVKYNLPLATALSVLRQSGTVAIEGDPELDIAVENAPVPIDIGELVDARYQVGKRLLGVYGYVGGGPLIGVELARRNLHAIPSTLVERAELVTMFDKSGISQTAARYLLKTKSQYVDIRLPTDSKLWTTLIDGKPALPQRRDNDLIVPMPTGSGERTRDLQLVYESSTTPFQHRGSVGFSAPVLALRESAQGNAVPIPIADVQWRVVVPYGFTLTNPTGSVYVTEDSGSSWLESLRGMALFIGGRDLPSFAAESRASSTERAGSTYREAQVMSQLTPQGPITQDYFSYGLSKDGAARALGSGGMAGQDNLDRIAPGLVGMPGSGVVPGSAPNAVAELAERIDGQPPVSQTPAPPAAIQRQAGDSQDPFAVQPPGEPNQNSAPANPFGAAAAQTGISPEPAQLTQPATAPAAPRFWALEGVRGLSIALLEQPHSKVIHMQSLGLQPTLRAVVVDQRRLTWLALTVAIFAGLVGVALRKTKLRTKAAYVVLLLIAAIACPLAVGIEKEMQMVSEYLMPVVCLLPLLYSAQFAATVFGLRGQTWIGWLYGACMSKGSTSTLALVAIFNLMQPGDCKAQVSMPIADPFQTTSASKISDQFNDYIQRIENRLPISVPNDVVVVPYSLQSMKDTTSTEKILVPYQTYTRLWQIVHPEMAPRLPPANFALSSGEFDVRLADGDSLMIAGELNIDVFVDSPVVVPLPLQGAVLESAMLDGSPARIEVRGIKQPQAPSSPSPPAQKIGSNAGQAVSPNSLNSLWLHVSGPGRKRLELQARVRVERRGGWRSIETRLPTAAANQLNIAVPDAATELRLGNLDSTSTRETTEPDQSIEAAIGPGGAIELQWRPKIAQSIADQTMSVTSDSIFDIQEDGLRFLWHAKFEFPRSRRSSFSFNIPSEYIVEKVVGGNIRGWLTRQEGNLQRVEVQLLQTASDAENLTLVLAKYGPPSGEPNASLTTPVVTVPEAKIHQGEISLRRSNLLEIVVGQLDGIRRTDTRTTWDWISGIAVDSPLPLVTFQSFRYTQTPYDLPLRVTSVKLQFNVRSQTLLKIAEQETRLESKLIFEAPTRPIYRTQIIVPEMVEISRPDIAGAFDFYQVVENGLRKIHINFVDGRSTTFAIVLRGTLKNLPPDANSPVEQAMQPIDLPRIQVSGASGQEGDIVIQAEPAYEVTVAKLQQAQSVLLDSVYDWLLEKQRSAAQGVVHFSAADYSGQLSVAKRKPLISSFSITNVRVTDRAIEETIYIDFSIGVTGIEQLDFTLPSSMREANIQAPLLRRKIITPIDASGDPPMQVRLELQREVMGQYRIVIYNDRELTTGSQDVPLPTIQIGRMDRRLVTLENAGNDELVIVEKSNFDQLQPSQAQWKTLTDLLGEKLSEAYVAMESQASPRLVYATKSRAQVQTVGARIGLAKTSLTVDENGTYRAIQEHRVENRTEQFLEIAMPEGSQLWTAWVAGEPVKPIRPTSASANRTTLPTNQLGYVIRIPLVKTAEGDLDYGVTIKYGGQLSAPQDFQRMHFPLPRTTNIRVELSQVTLRLPRSQKWFNFSGTLGRVYDEGDLLADVLAFKGRQLSELSDMLSVTSRANSFSRARAENNLKQLGIAMQNDSQLQNQQSQSGKLQAQWQANSAAISQAQEQLSKETLDSRDKASGNRESLGRYFALQENASSKGIVKQLDDNFYAGENAVQSAPSWQFDANWLNVNELGKEIEAAAANKSLAEKPTDRKVPTPELRMRLSEENRSEKRAIQAPQVAGGRFDKSKESESKKEDAIQSSEVSQRYLERLQSATQRGQTSGDQNVLESLRDSETRLDLGEVPATDGYLSSLDVPFPERGDVYYFSTPRGDLELSVQSVSASLVRRFIAIASILVVCLLAWISVRLCQSCVSRSSLRNLVACALFVFGLFSLAIGSLPIYGAGALIVALALAVYAEPRVSRQA